MDEQTRALRLKRQYEKKWMQLDGVVAVGLGGAPDKPAIIVSCLHNEDELRTQLPASIKNIPVLVQRSGEFHI